jgi:Zn-dependent M28 family amino/carboxypeptidase
MRPTTLRSAPPALALAGALAVALAGAFAGACAPGVDRASDPNEAPVTAAANAITEAGLRKQIEDLSADSMEGRAPGSAGEEKTVAYLQSKFQEIGLMPGNPDGTWIQNVSLIGYTSVPTASFTLGNGTRMPLRFPTEYVASSRHDRPETKVENSDVVFVGYGIVAPEYGWDDYKGVDVRGKTVIMLVNDPQVRVAGDTAQLDTAMFKGRAMTYYGRWTYKYEIASEKGAAAVLIVHETGPAGYGYNVVQGSFALEQFDVVSPNASSRVPVEGWITLDKARALFAGGGQDFDRLHAAAQTKEFTPVPLDAKASFTVRITTRRIDSKNVVAKLEGGDRKDEYVVYTAHWDHLGRDTSLRGDQINNGALDNASGTSQMIEIARAFKALPQPPARSVLFLAVTAEEKGLLGAKYYAQNPLYPMNKTAANINIDGVNQWGPTSDLTVIGLGNSDLDDILTSILESAQRTVRPDAEPEKGFYYRSDHFEFAKQGVPALYTDAGTNYVGKPIGYSQQKRDEYTQNDYHAVTDVVKPDWDLNGAVEDARVLFKVGYVVAQQARFPEWKPGTEFKAKRDSMMR